jgi:hypothetical protein
MPNPIKYTTGTETLALKKGNFYIGTGDVGKGPSDVTGFYQGLSPSESGYVIYLNKEGAPGGLSYHSAANDSELISFTNNLSGTSFTSATQCLNYYASQTDKVCFNRDYEPIVTDGLIFNLDAGFTPSYSRSGTTWYNLNGSINGSLRNGASYSGDTIIFDGINDDVAIPSLVSTAFTFNQWIKKTSTSSSCTSTISNEGTLLRVNNTQIVWWSNVIVGPITYNFTPNLNQWYNIAVSQLNNSVNIYLDSTLIISGATSSPNLTFGRNTIGSWGGGCTWLGDIAITQIYNKALTSQEVLQNFNAQKGRFGL